jgi:hypothetical protein
MIPILVQASLLLIFSQCCSSKSTVDKKITKDMKNDSIINSLSQGTALVSASVVELIEEDSKIIAVFQIDTVHGYGPNTPPIGSGSKLNIEIKENLIPNTEGDVLKYFEITSTHKLTLRPSVDRFLNNKGSWQILRIQ